MEPLGGRVVVCSALGDNDKQLSKVIVLILKNKQQQQQQQQQQQKKHSSGTSDMWEFFDL